jgi:hypothetical protein
LLAWRRDILGGVIVLFEGCYVIIAWLVVYTAGWSPGMTVIVISLIGLPLIVSGALFYRAGVYRRKTLVSYRP